MNTQKDDYFWHNFNWSSPVIYAEIVILYEKYIYMFRVRQYKKSEQ